MIFIEGEIVVCDAEVFYFKSVDQVFDLVDDMFCRAAAQFFTRYPMAAAVCAVEGAAIAEL